MAHTWRLAGPLLSSLLVTACAGGEGDGVSRAGTAGTGTAGSSSGEAGGVAGSAGSAGSTGSTGGTFGIGGTLGAGGSGGGTGGGGTGGGGTGGGGTGGGGTGGAGSGGLADVCPMGASPKLPDGSPRILVIGPMFSGPDLIATHLQGLLAADPAFQSPEVVSQASNTQGGTSLMSFWYAPAGRDARLAVLKGQFTWVVLLDDANVALTYPEIHFEGARTVACQARAAGVKPILLMTSSSVSSETTTRAEMAYRVGNGTGAPVVPVAYAADPSQGQVPAHASVSATFIAAASLYTALTGKSAIGTTYQPAAISATDAALWITAAADAVTSHATMTHYDAPFASAVKLQTLAKQPELTFMDSGTSSEAIWEDRMKEIVPRIGFAPKATAIGACNDTKTFDATCLATAVKSFDSAQYRILFARDYAIPASTIAAAGKQTDLTVQVWDRHYDGLPTDGAAAIEALDSRSMTAIGEARFYGLAWTPYHIAFAKLKTARPSIALTSDGTHATYPVGYALAAMSVVSRTSLAVPTAGLDPDTTAAVGFADETIRHLSSLSQWGTYVPDDPAKRPKVK